MEKKNFYLIHGKGISPVEITGIKGVRKERI